MQQQILILGIQTLRNWIHGNQLEYVVRAIEYLMGDSRGECRQSKLRQGTSKAHTVWNLNAISGRTKSNQAVIFLPSSSGSITIKELPMLRTTMSALQAGIRVSCC